MFHCVSIETATKTGMVMVFGEISTQGRIDYQKVIRDCIQKIGYDDSEKGVCWTIVKSRARVCTYIDINCYQYSMFILHFTHYLLFFLSPHLKGLTTRPVMCW